MRCALFYSSAPCLNPTVPLPLTSGSYWNEHIHDLEITSHPVGSPGFFADLDQYHFEKLHHLLRLVKFDGYRGKRVLEVGCGAGTDLVRFAKGGAIVTGVDLVVVGHRAGAAELRAEKLDADLREADGEQLPFPDNTFDSRVRAWRRAVHRRRPAAGRRVSPCREAGQLAIFQVYNRVSWLNALSKLMKVPLEHEDAPVLGKYSAAEFRSLLDGFSDVEIVEERFPVKSRLHGGWKGFVFNTMFVGTFNALPRSLVKTFRMAPPRVLPQMKLIKSHAFGNDFLLVDAFDFSGLADPLTFTREVCDRHRGIGADGLIVYELSNERASMQLFNADASRSEISGNGVRCLAAWIASTRSLEDGHVHRHRDRCRREGARAPESAGWPLYVLRCDGTAGRDRAGGPRCGRRARRPPSPFASATRSAWCSATSRRHGCTASGGLWRCIRIFPPAPTSSWPRSRLRIASGSSIWERGVGPTEASGTGACAAAVAAMQFGNAARDVQVVSPGGTQRVEWDEDGLFLTGWAELIADSHWLKP